MADATHTPCPRRADMFSLASLGFQVREAWMEGYYDGLHAIKRIGEHVVEVYVGNADNGEYGDLHYAPVVYVDDVTVASNVATVSKAARIADFRASMLRAAIAKASRSAV